MYKTEIKIIVWKLIGKEKYLRKTVKSSSKNRHSLENDQDNWKTWTKTWPKKLQKWQISTGKYVKHISYYRYAN